MELADLGFDGWFEERLRTLGSPDCAVARVTRVDKDRYLVRNEHNEVQAEPTGRLLFSADTGQELPCVGDWVFVRYHNDGTLAIIHDIFPRRTFLRRKSAGTRLEYQMIASNIDVAFIMQSCDLNFNVRRMERFLVMVNDGGVEPVILLSKSDLVSGEELQKRTSLIREANIHAKVMACSTTSGAGPGAVRQALQKGKTYCLLGSSGVGKTTLLNHLLGADAFKTNPVREKDGRGRHTTARRQMTVLDGGALLVDTPGMRELGLMGADTGIEDSFSDIHELARGCRFNDCTHSVEAGCAVLAAVQQGSLGKDRLQSYMKLIRESEYHEMSYAERRRKERQFGRMVRATMRQVKKRKPLS